MPPTRLFLLLLLLLLEAFTTEATAAARLEAGRKLRHQYRHLQHRQRYRYRDGNVEEACRVTRYRDVCVRSLAYFSHEAQRSPSKWARASVSVAVGEVKKLTRFMKSLRKYGGLKGRSRREALSVCTETIQDALDNLHQSLGSMRRLSKGEFEGQMNDVLTWLSAALTDEDTCADGFEGGKGGRSVRLVRRKVKRAGYITSNALALVNKLAATGLEENAGAINGSP